MEIVIEQSQMVDKAKDITYQAPFPSTVLCRKCKHQSLLIMLIHDDEALLVGQRPKGVRVWSHDTSVIAIYLCTECGVMRARWNQA